MYTFFIKLRKFSSNSGVLQAFIMNLIFYLSFLACRCDGNMASRKLKITYMIHIQFSSVAQSCPTLCNPMDYSTPASLSITDSQSLLKLIFIELVKPSNYLILCHPLLLLPSIFLSIRVFSRVSSLHQVAKLFLFYFFTFFSTLSF